MLNLQLPLALPQHGNRDTGELICRGLMHVINAMPVQVDPTDALLAPGPQALHTTRAIEVPIGDHTTPGYLFTPLHPTGGTVLLVHGTTAEKPLPYYFYIRALLKAGLRVMTFELDGHGANPRPLCTPHLEENVPAAVAWLRSQSEIDGDRLGLMGVSLGGACVLNAAPRVEGVRAVATVSTPHSLKLDDVGRLAEALTTLNVESLWSCFEASPSTLLSFVTTPMRVAESLAHPHEEMDLLNPKTLGAINQVVRHLNPLDNIAELKKTPVLVVNGSWDNITPEWQARDLYERAPGPRHLALVPRRNHFTIMTSTLAVNTTVNWFRRWL